MTALEKQLKAQVESLERRLSQLEELAGMDVAAIDDLRRQDAIEHMTITGDPSLIKQYLTQKNGRAA